MERPRFPDDPTAIRTTRPCCAGVLTPLSLLLSLLLLLLSRISEALARSSAAADMAPSRLGGRLPRCEADSDDVDLRFAGLLLLYWEAEADDENDADAVPAAAPEDALSRTTRFRTGLLSLLAWLLTGDAALEDTWALLARVCRLSSPIEAIDVLRALRLFAGFGCTCTGACCCCSCCWAGDDDSLWLWARVRTRLYCCCCCCWWW